MNGTELVQLPTDTHQAAQNMTGFAVLRALAGHISGLSGLLILISHLWRPDFSLAEAIGSAAATGIAVYLLLVVSDLLLQHIMQASDKTKPTPAAAAHGPTPMPGNESESPEEELATAA